MIGLGLEDVLFKTSRVLAECPGLFGCENVSPCLRFSALLCSVNNLHCMAPGPLTLLSPMGRCEEEGRTGALHHLQKGKHCLSGPSGQPTTDFISLSSLCEYNVATCSASMCCGIF
jgi:hypothetical protein